MACPDRNKDARIIAEIERRKAIAEGKYATEQHATMQSVWTGELLDIHVLGINQSRIISIEQLEPGVWLMHYKQ